MKKFLNIILLSLILFCLFAPTLAIKAVSTYEVYLGNEKILTAATYKEAYQFALTKEKENQNYHVIIKENGKVKYATYALVNFRTKASSSSTTKYTIEFNNQEVGYTNGYYGADAAFLGTNETGTKVRFMQSGVIGWVNASEVEVLSMEESTYPKLFTSAYMMIYKDAWELRHNISTNITVAGAGPNIILGQERPKNMENNTYYLSYDGHYFYKDSLEGFRIMIRDYKAGVRTHSSNPNDPYYNYYQFLSHRSISNYTSAQIKQDLSLYTSKPSSVPAGASQSQLFGEEISFIQYQGEFGANAILMYGTAKNESGNGKSDIAINKNNLFGHSAFDSSPGASAAGYVSVSQSIFAHAKKFISEGYLDPCDGKPVNGDGTSNLCHMGKYYGGNVGDKSSGMNVRYASDPYWGEKAAQNYYYFDKTYGLQDYGKYGIGIKTSSESYPIKASPTSKSATLYMTSKSTHYAVTILEKVTGEAIGGNTTWYKIQTDPVINSTRTGIVQDQGEYNYNHNIGYIHASYLGYVRDGKPSKTKYIIQFNPNGGKFSDNITSTKSVTVEELVYPEVNAPTRAGYIFEGWDKTVSAASENITYTAKWKSTNTYQITFDADGGIFPDGSTTKSILVGKGEIPTLKMEPNKEEHIFIGWDKKVVGASENTIYKATYKNIIEADDITELKENSAFFYLDGIRSNNGKLYIKGFQTIEDIDNNLNVGIQYLVMLIDMENPEKVFTRSARRIKDVQERPFPSYGLGKKDYSYAWFELETDFDGIEDGNYIATVMAYTNHEYSAAVLSNKMFAPQATHYHGKKEVVIRNIYYDNQQPIEFIVRSNKLADKTTKTYTYNQFDQFFELDINNSQSLHIKGYTYSYGMDLKASAKISRKIIFENIENYKTTTFSLNAMKGAYDPALPQSDSLSKTLAWYEGNLDISKLEKGIYRIYLATTSNISDISELTDLFNQDLSKKTKTINGKKYEFKTISGRGNIVALVIS